MIDLITGSFCVIVRGNLEKKLYIFFALNCFLKQHILLFFLKLVVFFIKSDSLTLFLAALRF